MISILEYNKDKARVQLSAKITRADSAQEFSYDVLELISEFDSVWKEQSQYLLSQAPTEWFSSEPEARAALIKCVTNAFDNFNGWPQYANRAYIPGETYEGNEVAFPPGVNPRA